MDDFEKLCDDVVKSTGLPFVKNFTISANASPVPHESPTTPPVTDSTSAPAVAGEAKPEASDAIDVNGPEWKSHLAGMEKLDAKAELENQIAEQQTVVADLAVDRLRKEIVAKSAKAKLDAAVESLEMMESDLAAGRFPLPFSGAMPGGGDQLAGNSASPLPGQQELPLNGAVITAAPDDESWRLVNVSELDLPGGVRKALFEAGLATLGKIADFTAADNRLTDVKGIGAGKAEKIEAALEKYWAENPRGEKSPAEKVVAAAGPALRAQGIDARN